VRQVKSATSRRAVAVDGRAEGEFELGSGRYRANVALRVPGQRVAQLTAHGVASVTEGTWTSEAQLALEGVPLGVVPALAEARVAGKLFGNVSLVRPKADAAPMLRARVTMQDVSVDLAKTGKGTVTVDSNGSQLHATAEFRGGAGTLTAEAHLPLDWTQLLPAVDRSRRVRLSVGSNGVDAVVLSPFLRDIFSRMSGRVSGNLEATLEPRKDAARKPVGDWEATVQGEAKVDDASLQIAPLGIEFHDMKLEAHVKPNGRLTEVHIEQATAKSRSEKPNVTVRDAVIFFDGLRVTRGHATLQMTGMPMMLEGVPQATATGSAQFQLERDKDGMVVKVDVPTLTARLPQASSRNVVDLGDNPAIEVVQALREPKGAQSTDRILPWRFDVNLRRGVRIRRSDLDIPLTGQLGIGLGEKTTVTGAVELEPGGRFQSWGKTWVIEAGRVAFASPDPSDPLLAATASWRAPEGTTVYVDVRGTLKHATLTLTSDPSRSEPEIMALLFGGSASGSSDESSTARTSESAYAGGLATAFNTIFADALVGGVELRTATDENKASYTAAVRLSENVWFEGTYRNRLEQQQSTTSTEPLDVSGTVDWRFRRNWSLRTEVGTLGTGLDLLWQYRY
jgi:autotransporter translocation and assembly factor TamB